MPNAAHSLTRTTVYATLLTLCACGGSSTGNTAPRFATIPQQSTASGTAVSLDVSTYVTNKEGDTLTYEVVSGGGAFAGSTYSNTFDTLGAYSVVVKVTDATGKNTTGTITVKVTSANLMAYDETEGAVPSLHVVDTDTRHTARFASGGDAVTFKAALPQGQVVYEKSVGGQYDLYVWDAYEKTTTTLGADSAKDERYVAKTSDGKVVFTVADGSDTDLYLWNPATGMTRTISNTAGQVDENAVVTADDLIFYESGSGGQRDVYYYDYANDVSEPVATGSTTERILQAFSSGAVLLSRVGGGGETDLLWFKVATGLVEIAGGTTSGFADHTKTFRAMDDNGHVYFEARLGSSLSLLGWDSATGDLRTIAQVTSPGSITFGQAAGVYATYGSDPSGTTYDAYRYSWTSNTSTTVANSSDSEVPTYLRPTGQVFYLRYVSSTDVDVWYWNGTSGTSIASAGSGAYSILKGWSDGRIVLGYDYSSVTGSPLGFYDAGTGIATPITASNALFCAAGVATGDFVMQQGTGTSADLYYWTGSTTALTTVSATASVGDLHVGTDTSGNVLFRKSDGTTESLNFWVKATGNVVALSGTAGTHSTATAFSATR